MSAETNQQFHKLWAENHMADDINAMLITGCVEDGDGETFHVDVVFSADKKALEAFLGKGQSNPWSLNSNDERFVLPWTSDGRPTSTRRCRCSAARTVLPLPTPPVLGRSWRVQAVRALYGHKRWLLDTI